MSTDLAYDSRKFSSETWPRTEWQRQMDLLCQRRPPDRVAGALRLSSSAIDDSQLTGSRSSQMPMNRTTTVTMDPCAIVGTPLTLTCTAHSSGVMRRKGLLAEHHGCDCTANLRAFGATSHTVHDILLFIRIFHLINATTCYIATDGSSPSCFHAEPQCQRIFVQHGYSNLSFKETLMWRVGIVLRAAAQLFGRTRRRRSTTDILKTTIPAYTAQTR